MLATATFIVLIFLLWFMIEDSILDIFAYVKQLKPKKLEPNEWEQIRLIPEKTIAIMIANWQEADVIDRMIQGNLQHLDYRNYHFFIGVYPNDRETIAAARKVESEFPHRVHVVINALDGPTSKGQMLNQIAQHILRLEPILKTQFDVFLMQDSEDILHPRSLKIINQEISNIDFLQTPIFSFPRKSSEWTAATYVDEFAELHTKDLFVRRALGAPVPSAGVGTALSRALILKLQANNKGHFLREDSLTEDYILGLSSANLGFKTQFCCYYFKNLSGHKEFIATREYFPRHFHAAVRQKSRWVLGIVFQGALQIEWVGNWTHKFYLYRDRRGPIANLISFFSLIITLAILFIFFNSGKWPQFVDYNWFRYGSTLTSLGFLNRLYQRMQAVYRVNGWKELWQVPLRWPLGIIINVFASTRALDQFQRHLFLGEPLKWVKTTHVLPDNFGLETATEAQPENVKTGEPHALDR